MLIIKLYLPFMFTTGRPLKYSPDEQIRLMMSVAIDAISIEEIYRKCEEDITFMQLFLSCQDVIMPMLPEDRSLSLRYGICQRKPIRIIESCSDDEPENENNEEDHDADYENEEESNSSNSESHVDTYENDSPYTPSIHAADDVYIQPIPSSPRVRSRFEEDQCNTYLNSKK